jgi:hypothetical protein
MKASGQLYLIQDFLKTKLGKNVVLFYVGANRGEYRALPTENFPNTTIYSFEPNPNTFTLLEKLSGKRD